MGLCVDMDAVALGENSTLVQGFNQLSDPATAPSILPGSEVAVITPSDFKALAPQGDGLDGARSGMWSKLS